MMIKKLLFATFVAAFSVLTVAHAKAFDFCNSLDGVYHGNWNESLSNIYLEANVLIIKTANNSYSMTCELSNGQIVTFGGNCYNNTLMMFPDNYNYRPFQAYLNSTNQIDFTDNYYATFLNVHRR